MKIQLTSTLPFTPVQLDTRHASPRRVVGQLLGSENGTDYRVPVYEFRHGEQDSIHYRIEPADHPLKEGVAEDGGSGMIWIEHKDDLTYKPYAFVVMDAMTKLVGQWDGVVYRAPSGEALRESAFQATLQIVDSCVCPNNDLWVMVSISGEAKAGFSVSPETVRQLGWVPVVC